MPLRAALASEVEEFVHTAKAPASILVATLGAGLEAREASFKVSEFVGPVPQGEASREAIKAPADAHEANRSSSASSSSSVMRDRRAIQVGSCQAITSCSWSSVRVVGSRPT
jgi:hypothetical protein